MTNEKILNKAKLLKYFEGDEDILKVITLEFIEKLPGYIENLEDYTEKRSFKSLEILAHTIKGLSATFCSIEVEELALKIENLSKEESEESLLELIDDFKLKLNELSRALNNEIVLNKVA